MDANVRQAMIRHGGALAVGAFNSGDFSSIADEMKNLASADKMQCFVSGTILGAAIAQLAQFIEEARALGYKFTPDPPTRDALACRAAISDAAFLNAAAQILDATRGLIRAVPGIRASKSLPGTAAPTPAPSQPIEVRIVAMPSRQALHVVERDEETLEIVSTTTTESDS